MTETENLFSKFNFIAECQRLRWKLWECPPFLFLILGLATITSMGTAAFVTEKYFEEPEAPRVILVSLIAVLFLLVGNIIIHGFNKIAEANRMKTEFISIISHQLRSPLSVFRWTLDVVEYEMNKKKDPQETFSGAFENFVQTMRGASDNMIKMVNTLLEASRIDAQTFTLKKEEFFLASLTSEIINKFKAYADASNVKIDIQLEPSLPLITGDKERLGIVIQNLLDNAIRYTTASGTIVIKIGRENSFIKWSIRDQGLGIPNEQQKFIFQKFFRGENAWPTQTRGSGIGLYLAREIIKASEGNMGFSSEKNKGSTFWFTLPTNSKANRE